MHCTQITKCMVKNQKPYLTNMENSVYINHSMVKFPQNKIHAKNPSKALSTDAIFTKQEVI